MKRLREQRVEQGKGVRTGVDAENPKMFVAFLFDAFSNKWSVELHYIMTAEEN